MEALKQQFPQVNVNISEGMHQDVMSDDVMMITSELEDAWSYKKTMSNVFKARIY